MLYFFFLGCIFVLILSVLKLFQELLIAQRRRYLWIFSITIILLTATMLIILKVEERLYYYRLIDLSKELSANRQKIEHVLTVERPDKVVLDDRFERLVIKNPLTSHVISEDYVINLYSYQYYLNGATYMMSSDIYNKVILRRNLEASLYYLYILMFQSQLYVNNLALNDVLAAQTLQRLLLRETETPIIQLKAKLAALTRSATYRKISLRERLGNILKAYLGEATDLDRRQAMLAKIYRKM